MNLIKIEASSFSVGNGGQIVRCGNSDYYTSLDYIYIRNFISNENSLIKAIDKYSYIDFVHEKLKKISPEIASDYNAFIQSFFLREKNSNSQSRYMWLETRFLPDLYLYEKNVISGKCKLGGGIDIALVIVRKEGQNDDTITFYYDEELIQKVNPKDISTSFLLTHEWLWNYTKSTETNRKLNAILHHRTNNLNEFEMLNKYLNNTSND